MQAGIVRHQHDVVGPRPLSFGHQRLGRAEIERPQETDFSFRKRRLDQVPGFARPTSVRYQDDFRRGAGIGQCAGDQRGVGAASLGQRAREIISLISGWDRLGVTQKNKLTHDGTQAQEQRAALDSRPDRGVKATFA